MLRITTLFNVGHNVHLKVEGQVVGDWVPILDATCGTWLAQNKHVLLDFSDVTFIDRSGVEALRRLLGDRVRIIGASWFVQSLLGLGVG